MQGAHTVVQKHENCVISLLPARFSWVPQGPQNGPKVARSVEFEFERDLRELEVGLVLKLEFELEAELELEHKLELELLRDARRALELQA